MKGIVSPETILDHVVAYTIGAGEVIQEASKNKIKDSATYTMTLVPFGPPFYTAILQAAGTLSINKDNKTAILMYQQDSDPDSILVYDNPIGPILGKTFSFPTGLKKLPKSITQFTKFTQSTQFTEILENQIHFIRIVSAVEELVIVGIGNSVTQKKIDMFYDHICKQLPQITSFFIANLSQEKELTSCRREDEKTITKIIKQTYTQIKDTPTNIIQSFSHISKNLKKRPEIVAYTNTGDLGGNKEKTNGYSCLIA